jgi:hypothetical protein
MREFVAGLFLMVIAPLVSFVVVYWLQGNDFNNDYESEA